MTEMSEIFNIPRRRFELPYFARVQFDQTLGICDDFFRYASFNCPRPLYIIQLTSLYLIFNTLFQVITDLDFLTTFEELEDLEDDEIALGPHFKVKMCDLFRLNTIIISTKTGHRVVFQCGPSTMSSPPRFSIILLYSKKLKLNEYFIVPII